MLAISISNNKLKIAEGFQKKNILNVTCAAQLECDTGVVSDGIINDSPNLQMLINEILSANPVKSKDAAIVIESGEIIVRDFTVPRLAPEEVAVIIEEKIKKILNKDDVEILTDYMMVNEIAEENAYKVMAYAVPCDMVKTYGELLKGMKMTPKVFDVIENTCVKLVSRGVNGTSEGMLMLVDIGHSNITYYGFNDGVLNFCRKDLSPVKAFFSDVSVIKKSEEDGGGDYLNELDFTPGHAHENPGIDEYCKKLVYNLSDYITRYIQYLTFNNGVSGQLSKIHICGPITAYPGIEEALKGAVGMPFEILKSAKEISLPDGIALNEYYDVIGALIRR